MDPNTFTSYLDELVASVRRDDRVLGVVGLGSTALDRPPDRYSDHDIWLVVAPGSEPAFRDDPWWLPAPERIVLWAFETEHGRTAMYDDAHVVEAAVFNPDELTIAKANHARVLLDRQDIAERVRDVRSATPIRQLWASPADVLGRVVALCVIGAGRWFRGERLNGHVMVKAYAVRHLLEVVAELVVPVPRSDSDGLDPWRRVERSHPSIAAALDAALLLSVPHAALAILDCLVSFLGDVDGFPDVSVGVARAWLVRESQRA